MKTHYVKDIRVLSAFQQTIRAMQILILVLRVLAVAFLVLQSITLMGITHRRYIYIRYRKSARFWPCALNILGLFHSVVLLVCGCWGFCGARLFLWFFRLAPLAQGFEFQLGLNGRGLVIHAAAFA